MTKQITKNHHKTIIPLVILLFVALNFKAYGLEKIGFVAVDDRNWNLLHPRLPSQPDLMMLTPERSAMDYECLIFERFPKGAGLSKDMIPADASIYDKILSKDDCTIAYEQKNGLFYVDRTFKIDGRFYRITYMNDSSKMSIADRKKWIAICNMTCAKEPSDSSQSSNTNRWLQVTDQEVYQDGRLLEASNAMETYEVKKSGFSVEFPTSWNCMEMDRKQPKALEGPGFTSCLGLLRKDMLALGEISICRSDLVIDYSDEREWLETVKFMKTVLKDKSIEAHGDIQNVDGIMGKYVVARQYKSGEIEWFAFYPGKGRLYKIQLFAEGEDIEALKETFEHIMTHFRIL